MKWLPVFFLLFPPLVGQAIEVKARARRDFQTAAPNCTAKREWVELSAPGFAGVSRVNEQIRRELTVGKKLVPARDCPGEGSSEDYAYHNSASFSGTYKNLVTIAYSIVFPGGSTRVVNDFRTYDLATGRAVSLPACLKEAASLQALFCRKMRAEHADPGDTDAEAECAYPVKDYQLALQAKGVNVATWATGKFRGFALGGPVVPWAEWDTYFKGACVPELARSR